MTDILDFGTYWFDNPAAHTNGEFDCVLKRSDGYDFIECKFYTKPMSQDECEKEEQQLKNIEGIVFRQIGFVCSAGFSFTSGRYDLITGEDLFSDKNR